MQNGLGGFVRPFGVAHIETSNLAFCVRTRSQSGHRSSPNMKQKLGLLGHSFCFCGAQILAEVDPCFKYLNVA